MIFVYCLILFFLGLYSYSQIDLNLTLLQTSWFLAFQGWSIQLGYFNRPISLMIFLTFTILLTVFYVYFLRVANRLSTRKIVGLVVALIVLGLLSYPAFSHDIFNYIFDARILVHHGQNPYAFTALDFPDDTWTRFMNWTHRTYPYGPTFLPITLPVYLLGFGKFIPTLFLFKALFMSAYAGSILLLDRLAGKRAVILFALNPLVIYEVVIAAHLDVLMLFFALLGIWLLHQNRRVLSFLSLLISGGIKYATLVFLPIVFLPKRYMKYETWILIGLSLVGAIIQSISRELLPHYFIVPIGLVALLSSNKKLVWLTIIGTFVLIVVRYHPFISQGIWLPFKPSL